MSFPMIWDLDCQANIIAGLIQELGGANHPVLISPLYIFLSLCVAYLGSGANTIVEFYRFATCSNTIGWL
jgi:hypothetical protein